MQLDRKAYFQKQLDVSRETIEDLERYVVLLEKWNSKINLTSRMSMSCVWERHVLDSAQLWQLPDAVPESWTDLGSGGGLPAVVLAIMARGYGWPFSFTLIESDLRKVAFLETVSAKLGLRLRVVAQRAELAQSDPADVVSARAMAPLSDLLRYAEKHRQTSGICLFPKGSNVHNEIREAELKWRFDYRLHPSITNPDAAVVEIGAMTRV